MQMGISRNCSNHLNDLLLKEKFATTERVLKTKKTGRPQKLDKRDERL